MYATTCNVRELVPVTDLMSFKTRPFIFLQFISVVNAMEWPGHLGINGAQMKLENGSIEMVLIKLVLMRVSKSNASRKQVCSFDLV